MWYLTSLEYYLQSRAPAPYSTIGELMKKVGHTVVHPSIHPSIHPSGHHPWISLLIICYCAIVLFSYQYITVLLYYEIIILYYYIIILSTDYIILVYYRRLVVIDHVRPPTARMCFSFCNALVSFSVAICLLKYSCTSLASCLLK